MSCPICGHSESDKPRSVQQLRMYWSMLNLVSDHAEAPVFQGKDGAANLHETLKIAMGYTKPIFDLQGNVTGYKADSVAFHKMPPEKFNPFFEKAQTFIFNHILPNIEQADFERELCNLLGMNNSFDR